MGLWLVVCLCNETRGPRLRFRPLFANENRARGNRDRGTTAVTETRARRGLRFLEQARFNQRLSGGVYGRRDIPSATNTDAISA